MATRQEWKVGDLIAIPLKDGTHAIGQVVGQEREVLNSATVGFFDRRARSLKQVPVDELSVDALFSVLFATRDLLDSGQWKVVARHPLIVKDSMRPYESLRTKGFVGAKVIGAGIVGEFLNAYFGLSPWDDWKDPRYLDTLLLSPDKKPSNLIFKGN